MLSKYFNQGTDVLSKCKEENRQKILWRLLPLILLFNMGCKKDWLEAKSDMAATVPATNKDLQLLLDNSADVFNQYAPELGEIGSDNYYITNTTYQGLNEYERNWYVWAPGDIYGSLNSVPDWDAPYSQVYYSNFVLEGATKINRNNDNGVALDNVVGSALFYRSFAFHVLASIFCKPFNEATAESDLGIPLRLSADFNEKSVRSTVRQTYDQIIVDLESAVRLLPSLPDYKTRPSKTAAYAELARVYLSMAKYNEALLYADSSLQLQSSLLSFSSLSASSTTPISRFNTETIFYSTMQIYNVLRNNRAIIDSVLYKSYVDNDLRKVIYFQLTGGLPQFKGSYAQSPVTLFNGLAVDELLLIRAECNARAGNMTSALNDLNTLLITRWKTGTFIPITALNADDALKKVLDERRKELCFRGLRWTDLRRLNKEERFKITLTRMINNQNFTLPPNDNRYVYPIPRNVIQLTGMPQNER